MKKLLFFLALLPLVAIAQYTPKYQVGPGEYGCFILDNSAGIVYDITSGKPTPVPGQPVNPKAVIGGAHHWIILDKSGNVWCWGDNVNGEIGNGQTATSSNLVSIPTQVVTDTFGHVFSNVIQVTAGGTQLGWNTSALKSDGTVWIWGNTGNGLRGNGQQGQNNTRPVQVNFPAGTFITQICIYQVGIALDSAGNVWTWGGGGEYTSPWNVGQGNANPDYTTPHKISLPSRAVAVAGGSYWNYALLATGSLYGWGYYTSYLGIGNGGFYGYAGNANSNGKMYPQLLDTALNLPKPVKAIAVNNNATYVILTDSTLWGWGDNCQGVLGNGVQINWATYHQPWSWDVGFGELMQQKPVQIAPGLHSFTNIFTDDAWCLYFYAEDVNNVLYYAGRGKENGGRGWIATDTTLGNIAAAFPDSWNTPWITIVTPLSITQHTLVQSPACLVAANASKAPCNLGIQINSRIHARIAVATGSAATYLLDYSTDTGGVVINRVWKEVSGPSVIQIPIRTSSGLSIANSSLVPGTYEFMLTVTDNGQKSDSTIYPLVVGATNIAPIANAGPAQSITLPADTIHLTGAASTDPDGTIASYSWQVTAGPCGYALQNPSSVSPVLIVSQAGVYTVQLTVTDNSGATSSATTTVTVNPVICPICPAPRTVTSVSVVINGITYTLPFPVSSMKFTFSDGSTQ